MSQDLKEIIVVTAVYYGRTLDREVLGMMAGDLEDLDPVKCIDAYQRWRRNPANKSFPLPAQIREMVEPGEFISAEAQAREIASRIVGSIANFGWNNARDAKAFIGPEGWDLVERYGGWNYLCENTGVNIQATTLQAQMRDQLEGTLRYGLPAMERVLRIYPRDQKPRQLESAADILSRIGSPPDKPEGA